MNPDSTGAFPTSLRTPLNLTRCSGVPERPPPARARPLSDPSRPTSVASAASPVSAGMPPWSGDVETPAAIVDLDRVRRNADATAVYARSHGLLWRPHVKTHKSQAIAGIQREAGASGLTVATPREAEVMASVTHDLLLAHPPVPPKARRVAALRSEVEVTVALDSADLLPGLAEAAAEAGRCVRVLVEVDVGMGRVGLVDPGAVVGLVRRILDDPVLERWLAWKGLLFYPGHIRVPMTEQGALLEAAGVRLGAFLEALDHAGLVPEVVSGGSTPTLFRSHEIPGITEIRPGTSIFHDRDSVALGVATLEEVAYTVLATVVSVGVPGQAVVDAGSKALAREEFRATPGVGGYGILLDRPDVQLSSVSEEHGILDLSSTSWRPRVGERVRIVPNHVCVSVNLQDQLLAFEGPEQALQILPLAGRGRLPFVPAVR